MDGDASYHQRRASEERRAAQQTSDQQAARAHIELAERHEERLNRILRDGSEPVYEPDEIIGLNNLRQF